MPPGVRHPIDIHFRSLRSDEDCDETNSSTNPGAEESCNGVDDDCDEGVDEGVADTWYADADDDPGSTSEACDPPTGTVADSSDCDDDDPAIRPGAIEICDGVDNDCDGSIDRDATDAAQ